MTERNKTLPLHTKYRPSTFQEFIGNEAIIESLQTILMRQNGEIRSFLFIGPSGAGKTTIARIMKNELHCSDQDFYEYDSANTRGIDTIRDIAMNSRYSPLNGKIKIYLLDECHKLTADGQNALLKLLEDPPSHTRFILATTDPEKLIKTIRTRCTTFSLTSLRRNELMRILKWICTEEKVEVALPILQKITECADGSPRQAIVLLDQIIDIENEELALQVITNFSINEVTTIDLCRKLLEPAVKWPTLSGILNKIDDDPEKVRYAILTYMSKVLLSNPSDRAANIIELFSGSFMYNGKAGLVLSTYLASKL